MKVCSILILKAKVRVVIETSAMAATSSVGISIDLNVLQSQGQVTARSIRGENLTSDFRRLIEIIVERFNQRIAADWTDRNKGFIDHKNLRAETAFAGISHD